jgi:hypothetical protein
LSESLKLGQVVKIVGILITEYHRGEVRIRNLPIKIVCEMMGKLKLKSIHDSCNPSLELTKQ